MSAKVSFDTGDSEPKSSGYAALRSALTTWAEGVSANEVEAWVSTYAEDAILMVPNSPPATDRQSIRNSTSKLMALEGFVIAMAVSDIVVADSQDVAYLRGKYEMTHIHDGTPVTDKGKFLESWRQRDGAWLCTTDIWNSDLPVGVPPPV